MNVDVFSNHILLELTDYILVCSNQDVNSKRFKTQRYYLPKGAIKSDNVTISRKNFYDQPIDSDIKQSEETGKLTTRQGEHYSNGCLLDYDHIKNYYRPIAINLIDKNN